MYVIEWWFVFNIAGVCFIFLFEFKYVLMRFTDFSVKIYIFLLFII